MRVRELAVFLAQMHIIQLSTWNATWSWTSRRGSELERMWCDMSWSLFHFPIEMKEMQNIRLDFSSGPCAHLVVLCTVSIQYECLVVIPLSKLDFHAIDSTWTSQDFSMKRSHNLFDKQMKRSEFSLLNRVGCRSSSSLTSTRKIGEWGCGC